MAPRLEQTVGNSIGSGQSRVCTVNLTNATKPGNLIVVTATMPSATAKLTPPSGFVAVTTPRWVSGLQLVAWYRENAPELTSVTVTTDQDRSLQVWVMEYSGAAQSNVVEKYAIVSAGTSGTIRTSELINSQADSVVVAIVANPYATTAQHAFSGAFTNIVNGVSPRTGWGFRGLSQDPDYLRTRLTIHQAITTASQARVLQAYLTAYRPWIAMLIIFKGGSIGPARMTSRNAPPVLDTSGGSPTPLTVFGKLSSGILTTVPPMLDTSGVGIARIGPSNYQYRLGGWSGLLIGDNTPYEVVSVEGLQGWQLRTSDVEIPRGDGALRGTDLMSSRQIVFEIKVGSDRAGVTNQQVDVEEALDNLRRALIPQRDVDWELIWRYPGQPLQMMYVRPVDMLRDLPDPFATVVGTQKFVLTAANPRIYSAFERKVNIAVTLASASTPTPTNANNLGNGNAYPLIRIDGPTSGSPVTRIELTNTDTDVSFVVQATLPTGSTLLGDMFELVSPTGGSSITIDGQTKFGAWQDPRDEFYLQPGANAITLQTVPAGAPVKCTLEYRDTSSG